MTPTQHDELVQELKKAGSFKVAVRHYENQENQDYADEFTAAGWEIRQPQFLISLRQSSGIFVLVPDGNNPPDGARQLWDALKKAGFEAQGVEVSALHPGTFDLEIGFPGELKL